MAVDEPETTPETIPPEVYVVTDDPGGVVQERLEQVLLFEKHGTKVVIDGPCRSACTYYLYLPPDQVCYTDNAIFGFHAVQSHNVNIGKSVINSKMTAVIYQSYPNWVKFWAMISRAYTSWDIVYMSPSYHKLYMKKCEPV